VFPKLPQFPPQWRRELQTYFDSLQSFTFFSPRRGCHQNLSMPMWSPTKGRRRSLLSWTSTTFLGLLQLQLLLRLQDLGGLRTTSRKVSILMTNSAFKWKLLIIHLLNISPLNEGELNSLRQPIFQIHFDTNSSTSLQLVSWFDAINVFT
jgi:hypothetical protein